MQRFIDNGDNTITDNKSSTVYTKEDAAKTSFHDATLADAESLITALGEGYQLPVVNQRYIKNPDNTVTDTKTGLVWSHTLGRANDCKAADKLAKEFGPEFRLPNPEELQTIVDRSKYSPAIDTDAFPDTKNAWYWTSEPCAWDKSARWVVGFGYGDVDGDGVNDDACVRAVRGGQ